MRRLVALLALLVPLSAPAVADAHVTRPGYSEIRQDGKIVTYVLGIETGALEGAAGGEDKAALANYLPFVIRVTVGGESCASRMTGATPERHQGVAFTRATVQFRCPAERGEFLVHYDIPARNIVDYELGGASGTFVFDADHNLLEASSPGLPRFVHMGVEHILLGFDHVLFLAILLLGAKSLRSVIKLATAFTVAHSVTLALAVLGWVEVPAAIVEPLIALSIVYVAVENVLGGESRHRLAVVFAFGLLHGLGFASAVSFADGTRLLGALVGFNLGIELGQALIVVALFPLLLLVRRFTWSSLAHAAAGSAAAAMGLFWFSERVLG